MDAGVRVVKRSINERNTGRAIDTLLLEPAEVRRTAVFAVGAGGDPERHLPLLAALAAAGCRVAAPYLGRLTSMTPTADELSRRASAVRLAFDHTHEAGLCGVGIGHSLGAALLLILTGAEVRTITGEALSIEAEKRLGKLALMAPALDFFKGVGALDKIQVPICVWAGGKDQVTPPPGLQLLSRAGLADIRITADAGHFSFMNSPPPHATEPLHDRSSFLARLAMEVASYTQS